MGKLLTYDTNQQTKTQAGTDKTAGRVGAVGAVNAIETVGVVGVVGVVVTARGRGEAVG